MATRKRTSAQRTESKRRKILHHQQQLETLGLPVYAFTLETHFDDDTLYPTQVYKAPLQQVVEGYGRNSQTAVVMMALEKYGAENARL
jgi:hypothetical protein